MWGVCNIVHVLQHPTDSRALSGVCFEELISWYTIAVTSSWSINTSRRYIATKKKMEVRIHFLRKRKGHSLDNGFTS
jgi:hypothetical protein